MKDVLNFVKYFFFLLRLLKLNCKNDMIFGLKLRLVSNFFVDFVYKGFDFDVIVLDVLYEDLRDIFKGFDFNCLENVLIGLGDIYKGLDFNSFVNLNDNNIELDIEDIYFSVEFVLFIKVNFEDFLKIKLKFNFYVNVDVLERKLDKFFYLLMYVN